MNRKVLISIALGIVILIGVGVVALATQSSPGKDNEINIKETKSVATKHTVEYGDNIDDEIATLRIDGEDIEVELSKLSPEIDTMKVGRTTHTVDIDGSEHEIDITVRDTKSPEIKGVKESFEFKSEADIEKELKKLITAEDPVDGEVEVEFEIEKEKRNNYNVKAIAEDKNGNVSVEEFEVTLKAQAKKKDESSSSDEKSTKANKGNSNKQSDKKSSSQNKSNSGKSSNVTKPSSSNNTSKPSSDKSKPAKNTGGNKASGKSNNKNTSSSGGTKKPSGNSGGSSSGGSSSSGNSGGGGSNANVIGPDLSDDKYQLKKPSSVPSGAKLKKDNGYEHIYSYKKTLPGGGNTDEVVVDGYKQVSVVGTNSKGDFYNVIYDYANNRFTVMMGAKLTEDEAFELKSICTGFASHYR